MAATHSGQRFRTPRSVSFHIVLVRVKHQSKECKFCKSRVISSYMTTSLCKLAWSHCPPSMYTWRPSLTVVSINAMLQVAVQAHKNSCPPSSMQSLCSDWPYKPKNHHHHRQFQHYALSRCASPKIISTVVVGPPLSYWGAPPSFLLRWLPCPCYRISTRTSPQR